MGSGRPRSRAAVALAVLVALAAPTASGCGDDDDKDKDKRSTPAQTSDTTTEQKAPEPYNTDTLEKTLLSNLERGGAPSGGGQAAGPRITSVECPADTRPATGASVDCDATGEGLSGSVTVRFTDESGSEYTYKADLKGDAGFTQTVEGRVTGK